METATILELVKARLGISTTIRDTYITAIVESVLSELTTEKGLSLDDSNSNQKMFAVDYATWRYQNKDSEGGMPRHLQFRLHNLMIGNKALNVSDVLTVNVLPTIPDLKTVYILADGTKQMYINSTWTVVNLLNGVWVIL